MITFLTKCVSNLLLENVRKLQTNLQQKNNDKKDNNVFFISLGIKN